MARERKELENIRPKELTPEILEKIRNNRVGVLDLSYAKLNKEEVKKLAEALKVNKSLTSLDLRANNIGAEGAKALAQALKKNKSLTSLNLWNNNIGAAGAKAIAQALQENKSLTSLELRNNNIGDEGAKAIAQALQGNKRLTYLDIGDNNIGVEGAKEIAQALKENKSLTSLRLEYNNIGGDELTSQIKALIERNCKFRDDFTLLAKAAINDNDKIGAVEKEMTEIPLVHQTYALAEIIKTAGELSKTSVNGGNITNHLKMIKFFLGHNVPVTEDVLEAVKESDNPEISALLQSADKNSFLEQQEVKASERQAAPLPKPSASLEIKETNPSVDVSDLQEEAKKQDDANIKALPIAELEKKLSNLNVYRQDLNKDSSGYQKLQTQHDNLASAIKKLNITGQDFLSEINNNTALTRQELGDIQQIIQEFDINQILELKKIASEISHLANKEFVEQKEIAHLHLAGGNPRIAADQRATINQEGDIREYYESVNYLLEAMFLRANLFDVTEIDRKQIFGGNVRDKAISASNSLISKIPLIGGLISLGVEFADGKHQNSLYSSNCTKIVNLYGSNSDNRKILAEALARKFTIYSIERIKRHQSQTVIEEEISEKEKKIERALPEKIKQAMSTTYDATKKKIKEKYAEEQDKLTAKPLSKLRMKKISPLSLLDINKFFHLIFEEADKGVRIVDEKLVEELTAQFVSITSEVGAGNLPEIKEEGDLPDILVGAESSSFVSRHSPRSLAQQPPKHGEDVIAKIIADNAILKAESARTKKDLERMQKQLKTITPDVGDDDAIGSGTMQQIQQARSPEAAQQIAQDAVHGLGNRLGNRINDMAIVTAENQEKVESFSERLDRLEANQKNQKKGKDHHTIR